MTTYFFATDLHGSTLCFRKFLATPRFYEANVLILGGDLTGKALLPALPAERERLRADPGVQDRVERSGVYLWDAEADDVEQLKMDISFEREVVDGLASKRLTAWLERAEQVLSETQTACYVIGGNDDSAAIVDVLAAHEGPLVRFCEDQTVEMPGGLTISGFGWATPTPWNTPRELADEDIERRLREVVATCPDPTRAVFSIHVPPYEVLDVCPMLDTSVDPPRPIVQGGQVVSTSVGSRGVRRVLQETQPLAMLCGHIHESRGARRLGKTLVVNPGSQYSEGVLQGSLVTVSKKGKIDYQLTSG